MEQKCNRTDKKGQWNFYFSLMGNQLWHLVKLLMRFGTLRIVTFMFHTSMAITSVIRSSIWFLCGTCSCCFTTPLPPYTTSTSSGCGKNSMGLLRKQLKIKLELL